MKLTLPRVALIALVATTAFTATSANAVQFRSYRCDIDFFAGCGVINLQEPPPAPSPVTRISRDTSPTYMKQIRPALQLRHAVMPAAEVAAEWWRWRRWWRWRWRWWWRWWRWWPLSSQLTFQMMSPVQPGGIIAVCADGRGSQPRCFFLPFFAEAPGHSVTDGACLASPDLFPNFLFFFPNSGLPNLPPS